MILSLTHSSVQIETEENANLLIINCLPLVSRSGCDILAVFSHTTLDDDNEEDDDDDGGGGPLA